MAIRTRVREGKIIFSSLMAEQNFMERAKGKDVLLTIDDTPSREIKGFFEGCLVPAFFYWHSNTGWRDFRDAREVIKAEFLPTRTIKTLSGEEISAPPSMSEVNREAYAVLVELVVNWMIENGMPVDVVDSEQYKKWRDSAVEPGSIYPPLQRLIQRYNAEREEKKDMVNDHG